MARLREVPTANNSNKNKSLFRPTDIEVGPDGALYVLGWGQAYGSLEAPYGGGDKKAKMNEGRVFKIWYDKAPLIDKKTWYPPKRDQALSKWTYEQLIEDLDHQVRIYTVDAQDELVRRGAKVVEPLKKSITSGKLPTGHQTWAMWALGRIDLEPAQASPSFCRTRTAS